VLNGVVSAILPETNPDSRTLRVRVELPNPEGRLRPGMTARVSLDRSTEQSVLWVPSEAVIRTGRRALVMLAEDAGRYRPVEVQLGQESDGKTAILKGLEEGQKVVTSGQFLLDSEASLKGIVAKLRGTFTHQSQQPPVCMRRMGRSLRSTIKKSHSPTAPSRRWACLA
jgi:membrane fusion protein, copper/silver efflux system